MGHRNRNQLDYVPLNRRREAAAQQEQDLENAYDDAGLNASPEALPGPWSGLTAPAPAATPDRNTIDYTPLNQRAANREQELEDAYDAAGLNEPPPAQDNAAAPARPSPQPAPPRVASRESADALAAPSPSAAAPEAALAKYDEGADAGGMKDEIPEDELTVAQREDRDRERRAQIIGGFAKILSGGRAEMPDANAHAAQDVLARRQALLQERGANRSDQYLAQERLMFDARQRREDEDRQTAALRALDEARLNDPTSPESRRHQALVESLRPNVSPEARGQLTANDVDARALINQPPPAPRPPPRDYAAEERQRHADQMELQERRYQLMHPGRGHGAGQGHAAPGLSLEQANEALFRQEMERNPDRDPEVLRANIAAMPADERERQRRAGMTSIGAGGTAHIRAGVTDTRINAQNARTDAAGQQRTAAELETAGIPEMTTRLDLADRDFANASDGDIRAAVLVMNHPTLLAAAPANVQQVAQHLSALQNIALKIRSGTAVTDPEMRRIQTELGTQTFSDAASTRRAIQDMRRVMEAQAATIRGGAPHLTAPAGGTVMMWNPAHTHQGPVPADRVAAAEAAGYSR